MRMKTKSSFVSALVAALITSYAASLAAATIVSDKKLGANEPYALIFGSVYGPDMHPARGVKIKIRRESDKKTIDLVSDNRGEFAHRFPAGKADYVVWVDLKDKQAAQKTEVKVHIEKDERQDLTLHLSK